MWGIELRCDLDAQIAAGDHDAVGGLEDLVEVLDAQGALDLREDRHMLAAVHDAQLADLLDSLAVTDKGSGDVVDAFLETKEDVLAVALGDSGQADVHVGHVDALALADLAAVLDDAVDVVAVDGLDFKANQAVVDQDRGALGDFVGEVEVVEGDVLGATEVVLGGGGGGHDDGIALGDGNFLVVFEQTGANLGALGVE